MPSSSAAAYEKDQEILQREMDGERGSTTSSPLDDVSLTEPQAPEVNPVIYRDVESMLFRGFVVSTGKFESVPVVWKNLNHTEFDFLTLVHDPDSIEFQNAFLARSMFIIAGRSVLAEQATGELEDFFSKLPHGHRAYMVRELQLLNERASRATRMVEAYAMEKNSRWRWAQIRGLDMSSPSLTGIRGTEVLGYNWCQLIWRALNQNEDQIEALENSWDHAKFIGSCFTKLDKVYSSDRKRRQDNQRERIRRKDQILREVVLFEDPEASGRGSPHRYEVAMDAKDLIRQVKKELAGEKDFHDEVIEAATKHYQDTLAEQERMIEEARKESEARFGSGSVYQGGADISHPIDPSQLQEFLRKNREETPQIPKTSIPILPVDPERMRRYGFSKE